MVWYLIEGFYHRQDDLKFSPSDSIRYDVVIEGFSESELIFYKGIQSGKWWMRVSGNQNQEEPEMVPCREEDYFMALEGNIPSRWINQNFSLS
jgi:hypothetical protein